MTTIGGLGMAAAPAWAYGPTPGSNSGTGAVSTTDPTTVPQATPAAASTSNGGLAFTGADVTLATAVGAGAIGAGGFIVLMTRRRRQHSQA
ncbi:MAG: hypothetical protein JO337_10225 [Acidimicrobiales bacterium]|nr:hypothetical protein [Acidimicrobiales bacterium]